MTTITILDSNNAPMGPFTREQVAAKLQAGEVSLDSLAFAEGFSQWTPLRDVLAKVDAPPMISAPPVIAPAYSYAVTMEPPPHLIYAGFWIRVGAHIIDNLIIAIPMVIIWMVIFSIGIGFGMLSFATHPQNQQVDPKVAGAMIGTFILLYFSLIFGRLAIAWLYHAILESGPHQSTWGKRALGLKVTSITGQRISFGHASGRYFSTLITGLTMGVGYVMVAFTDRKQTLHDMIVGTLVIQK